MKIFEFFTNLFKKKEKQPKKIGLALGSGGAKGFALIGAMAAFEEHGIKFDMISGTSIGSIVGAMTACGYTSKEILNFITHYDLTDKKTLLMMMLKHVTVESALDEMLGGATFSETKISFYAVCTELMSGKEVVLSEGSLAKALACSSAIAPVFKAKEFDGMKLVDGAYVNAVPASVLKQKGCDVIISVSLTAREHNFSDLAPVNSLYKNHGIKPCDRLKSGIEASTVYIEPDLRKFSSSSTSGFNEMYEIGYKSATESMPLVLAAISQGDKTKKKKAKKNNK